MYIAVDEKLVKKHCSPGKLCFWTQVALLTPHNGQDLFVFDCSMHQYVKEEYKEYPDHRMLLTFKSPFRIDELAYAGNMGFHILCGKQICDHAEISEYITSVFRYIEARIEEAGKELAEVSYHKESLGRLIPLPRRDKAVLRGIYYGLKIKKDILKDIACRIGYEKGSLNAYVKPAYVMISLDLEKNKYAALILSKRVELKVHSRLIDRNSLINTISTRYVNSK